MFSKRSAGPFFSSARRVMAPISRSQSTAAVIRFSSPCCCRLAIHCRVSRKPIGAYPPSLIAALIPAIVRLRNGFDDGMPGETMSAAEIFNLQGKVALVTGASSGLGARFAEVLAENGAAVVLVARRADRLAVLKTRIEKMGGRAVAVEADVRDRAAMQRAFDAAEKAFGTVTILINNAGVAHAGRAGEISEEEWRRVLSTNLDAVLYWSQEAARRMLAAGKG